MVVKGKSTRRDQHLKLRHIRYITYPKSALLLPLPCMCISPSTSDQRRSGEKGSCSLECSRLSGHGKDQQVIDWVIICRNQSEIRACPRLGSVPIISLVVSPRGQTGLAVSRDAKLSVPVAFHPEADPAGLWQPYYVHSSTYVRISSG
jgi:hypothetical protein